MELKKVTKLKEMKNILVMDDLKKNKPEMFLKNGSMKQKDFEKLRAKNPIQIRYDKNSISFTLQNGPVKDVGRNGCSILDMAIALGVILLEANEELPCKESSNAIQHILGAVNELKSREKRREDAGISGTMEEVTLGEGSYLIIRDNVLYTVEKDESLLIGDIIPYANKMNGTLMADKGWTNVIKLTILHKELLSLVQVGGHIK